MLSLCSSKKYWLKLKRKQSIKASEIDVKVIGADVLKGTDLYTACYYKKKFLMAGNSKISREQWANLCCCPYLPVAYMYELVWIRIVLSEQNCQFLMCLIPSEILLSKKYKISMFLKCFAYRISSLIYFIRQGLPIFWAWNSGHVGSAVISTFSKVGCDL